jgi:pimeloyl-ACP methyl ester carboxylesterase
MKRKLLRRAWYVLRACIYTALGTVVGGVALYLYLLQSRPDLSPWHEVALEEEFTVRKQDEVATLEAYLALEDRLFKELDERIYARVAGAPQDLASRFRRGSLADPTSFPKNWNRTFELPPDDPRAGVLLLHGLSDSPYSLRALGETLHRHGYYVLGLRMPGHGTAPSGLVRLTWQDIAAAVKLAAGHVSRRIGPERPFTIVGYSMGAAQAVNYALASLTDRSLRRPDSLVLISPAIGISPLAALAVWESRLSAIPWLNKVGWTSITPEYDPYKYASFAVNAGDLMYRLTVEIGEKVAALAEGGTGGFPRTLAFLSAADATVSAGAVVSHLLQRLENQGNELVIFDINRDESHALFIGNDPKAAIEGLLRRDDLRFDLTLLGNLSPESDRLVAVRLRAGEKEKRTTEIDLSWPGDVYSLSHVALPFRDDDPLYGSAPAGKEGLHIGLAHPRGERGVLNVPADELLRLRYNPFYPYLERRTELFLGLGPAGE